MSWQESKAINLARKILGVCALIVTVFLLFVIAVCALDYMEVWSDNSIFSGASFLSPIWLLLPVVLLAGILFFMRKRTLASIFVIAYTFYFIIFGDISFASIFHNNNSNGEEQISVLSLNVRYYSYGMEKVFSLIDSVDADVVFLCENTLPADSIKLLSNLDDKYSIFAGRKYATAVLSKFPVISSQEVEFPTYQASLSGSNIIDSLGNNPHRSFYHARLLVDEKEIDAISVRFIAGRPKTHKLKDQIEWGKYLLEQQRKEIAFFVDYVNKLNRPVVFGGDLNAPPNAKIMKPLYDIAQDAALNENLIPSLTFRTSFPVMRLDYLFTMNGFRTIDYEKVNAVVSDHFPIYAKLALAN